MSFLICSIDRMSCRTASLEEEVFQALMLVKVIVQYCSNLLFVMSVLRFGWKYCRCCLSQLGVRLFAAENGTGCSRGEEEAIQLHR